MSTETLLIIILCCQILLLLVNVAHLFLTLHIGFEGSNIKKDLVEYGKQAAQALSESQKANQIAQQINEFLLKK